MDITATVEITELRLRRPARSATTCRYPFLVFKEFGLSEAFFRLRLCLVRPAEIFASPTALYNHLSVFLITLRPAPVSQIQTLAGCAHVNQWKPLAGLGAQTTG